MNSRKPVRILQVVGGLYRGGIETWLMHILRHIDREQYRMDFMVHTSEACAYDEEVRALGSQIYPCLGKRRPWVYAQNFRRILREHGPYDVIHSHVHHYSGYVLRLAQEAGVPVRIAHSHSSQSSVTVSDEQANVLRKLYLVMMKRWIRQHATYGLAASRKAAEALFGAEWDAVLNRKIFYYTIDLAPFRQPLDPAAVRAELGIPADAFVVGHVGTFTPVKNHSFLLEVAAELAKIEPKMRLVLVGDGYLRPSIEEQACKMGLAEQVLFTGLRSDVPRLMRGAMDVFVMPSLYEGLPIAGVEAQSAGIPAVLSDTITNEVDLIPELVRHISLAQPASNWAQAILQATNGQPAISRQAALHIVEQSPFNIQTSVRYLEDLYCV